MGLITVVPSGNCISHGPNTRTGPFSNTFALLISASALSSIGFAELSVVNGDSLWCKDAWKTNSQEKGFGRRAQGMGRRAQGGGKITNYESSHHSITNIIQSQISFNTFPPSLITFRNCGTQHHLSLITTSPITQSLNNHITTSPITQSPLQRQHNRAVITPHLIGHDITILNGRDQGFRH